MPCERPYKIINPKYKNMSESELRHFAVAHFSPNLPRPPDYHIEVACGRCHSCQKKRAQHYRFRLQQEFLISSDSIFVTLSFDDNAIEEYKDNYNKPVLQFLDALRKHYGKEFRHFFVFERGDSTNRPHYHGILFNLRHIDFYFCESVWNRGNGKIRRPDEDIIGFYKKPRGIIWLEYIREPEKCSSYLTKYITKEYDPSFNHPRLIISKGLGQSFLTPEVVDGFKKSLEPILWINGLPQSLPQYYKDKIYTKEDKLQMAINRFNNPQTTWFLNGREFYTYESYKQARSCLYNRKVILQLSPNVRKMSFRKPKKVKPTLFNHFQYYVTT